MPARCPAYAGCPTCLIVGQGNPAADGMIVGEAGGVTEHATCRPFAGKTGVVLSAYLKAAGLARPDLFITNLYPFWPGPEKGKGSGNRDPEPGEIAAEQWRLEQDIQNVGPKVIAAVGRLAARWFLGDVDISTVNAQPYWSDKAPGAVIVPIVHPAAGFYEPTMAAHSQAGFLAFAHFLKNPVPRLPAPRFKYVLHTDPPEWIEGAVDTEGLVDAGEGGPGPWGVSWSDGKTNHVYIWRKGDRPPKLRGRIVFHNALHDLVILRAMGIETDGLDYDDTMVGLYNLQLEPQGLKPASFRFLNLRMHDFDGVVRPHFDKLAVRWLKEAAAHDYPKPAPIPIADFQKKKDRLYRPQGIGQRLQSMLRSHEKDPTKKGLEKRWAEIGQTQWCDQTEEYQAAVLAKMGRPFPHFSIHCVPIKEAVRYSGQDAGATARLHQKLQPILRDRGLSAVYEMDRKALPFVDRMQQVGMRVEVPLLRVLEADLEAGREKAARRIRQIVGDRWFNPGSGNQVADWLYEVRGLPVLNYTDSGRGSTSDGALQMLKGYHAQDPEVMEFITAVQDYREADKYDGTFVKPIFNWLRRDADGNWRLHANFRVTRVVSGRLSSHEPNVLALPSRTALGKRIRECFVAGAGWLLIDCDVGQAELRTLADHSQDPTMCRAFRNDEDLHILTASLAFKRPIASIKKDSPERYIAKCFHPDTEVLSRTRGWVKIVDIDTTEEIAQAWPSDGGGVRLEWTKPTEVYTTKHPSGSLIHFKSEGIDLSVTPDHRMLYFNTRKDSTVATADNLPLTGWIAGAGVLADHGFDETGKLPREVIVRLAIATQADGSYSGKIWKSIRFGFTRQRKIDRMRDLLTSVDPHHKTWKEGRSKQGVTLFTVYGKLSGLIRGCLDPDKTLSWSMLRYPPGLRRVILEEARNWDSSNRVTSYTYCSVIPKNLDILQALAATTGYSSRRQGTVELSIKNKMHSNLKESTRETVAFTDKVACLSVPSSFVLVRSGGIPVISGQTLNFAIAYGISARALLEQLYAADIFDFSLQDCERFIRDWYGVYGAIRRYLQASWDKAAETGYVEDMWGRRCYVPNLRVMDEKLREAAQRLAGNFPIQSAVSGLVKRAEVRVHDWIDDSGLRDSARPWLQMHDELLLEVKEEVAEEVRRYLQAAMTADQGRFRVPLKADATTGRSWAEAK